MYPRSPAIGIRRICRWLLLASLPWLAQPAQACTQAETGGVLTSATSQRVYTGATITTSGSFSFTCGGVVFSALAGTPTLTGTMQNAVTGLTLKNGAFSIPYQLYSNAGYSTPFTSGAVMVSQSSAALIGSLNGPGLLVPVYIATTPGVNIPAGTYTDTIQLTWAYTNICEGLVNVSGLCLGVLNNGSITRSLVVTLVVTNDCTITAPPVAFGTSPLLSGFGTVSQNISLVCTKGMAYTVGLSAGTYPNGGRRRMASGSDRLEYDIFKGDFTVWGSLATSRANGPAVADGTAHQTIPYTARIYTDQPAPATGTYNDNVVVDVSF